MSVDGLLPARLGMWNLGGFCAAPRSLMLRRPAGALKGKAGAPTPKECKTQRWSPYLELGFLPAHLIRMMTNVVRAA